VSILQQKNETLLRSEAERNKVRNEPTAATPSNMMSSVTTLQEVVISFIGNITQAKNEHLLRNAQV